MVRWEHLRQFGNSPLVRSTIAVPIVGYLILLNEQLADLARLSPAFSSLDMSYPWRLSLTYLGLTFIAIGSVIYALAAPSIAKKYGGPVDYNGAEHSFWLAETNRMAKLHAIVDEQRRRREHGTLLADADGEVRILSSTPAVAHRSSDLTFALTVEWSLANTSRPIAALTTASLFGLGTALAGIPTVFTFCEVTFSIFGAALRSFSPL